MFDSYGTLHSDAHVIDGQVVDGNGNLIEGCHINDDGNVVDAYWNEINPETGKLVEEDTEVIESEISTATNSKEKSKNNTKLNASQIFNNLEISDFTWKNGSYAGTMSCKVKNNNTVTVGGYFNVIFYSEEGDIVHTQLMSLPDVASGEIVVCTTPTEKDLEYDHVDFSQASLVER